MNGSEHQIAFHSMWIASPAACSARPVLHSLSLIVEMTGRSCGRLRPATSGGVYNRRSFAATGRGWAHPTFTCRRPAPGRRARWLEIQEARCDRFRRSGSNVAEPETAERHMAVEAGQTDPADGRSFAAGSKDAATRVPKGNPLRRAHVLHGPSIGCGVGTRVPVVPRRRRRRGCRCWSLAKETSRFTSTWKAL